MMRQEHWAWRGVRNGQAIGSGRTEGKRSASDAYVQRALALGSEEEHAGRVDRYVKHMETDF